MKSILAASLLSCSVAAQAVPITPAFEGGWYNPDRSGEGIVLNIGVSTNRVRPVILYWFTYAADGNQKWLVGNTVLEQGADSLMIPVYSTVGPIGAVIQEDEGVVYLDAFDCDTLEFTHNGLTEELIQIIEAPCGTCVNPTPPAQPPGVRPSPPSPSLPPGGPPVRPIPPPATEPPAPNPEPPVNPEPPADPPPTVGPPPVSPEPPVLPPAPPPCRNPHWSGVGDCNNGHGNDDDRNDDSNPGNGSSGNREGNGDRPGKGGGRKSFLWSD